VFTDLGSVPSELRLIPIRDLVTRISELQSRAEDFVEIDGLHLQPSELWKWGGIALLAVQSTFGCTSTSWFAGAPSNAAGFDVAWIGNYRTRSAAATVLLSACALPLSALLLLTLRALPKAGSTPRFSVGYSTAGVFVGGFFLAPATGKRLIDLRR
jgi:hypothetical protein